MVSYFFWLLPLVCGKCKESGDDRDDQVSSLLEAMWSEGETNARAGDLISFSQWHYNVKSVMPGSWRIFKTWCRLEPSQQVWPLPISELFFICGLAIQRQMAELAALPYVAFHASDIGTLRSSSPRRTPQPLCSWSG